QMCRLLQGRQECLPHHQECLPHQSEKDGITVKPFPEEKMNRTLLILRHTPEETAGTLETALTGAGLEIRYIDLFAEVPERLPLDEASGLVVLGGPMNADEVDRYPFLKLDVQWIQQAIEAKLPLMGICLGSQLMAKALGARVYRNKVKEIGWYMLEWLPAATDDPLFSSSSSWYPRDLLPPAVAITSHVRPSGIRSVFQWHGDTFDLPPGAILLARGSSCQNQAFRWGTNAYGLQFHIEMTAAMIEEWLEKGDENEVAASGMTPRAIRELTPLFLPHMQRFAAEVFGRFAGMCLES
ncbi:MAG: gamma-glutamyl-gamma-aminobutyrate hydrolase family protein, partial [Thermoguttaceae bacterium]